MMARYKKVYGLLKYEDCSIDYWIRFVQLDPIDAYYNEIEWLDDYLIYFSSFWPGRYKDE